MGVNFSAFEIGRRALRASQLGISVAGQNIANVNTPGYTRQTVQLSAAQADGVSAKTAIGVGVNVDGVRSYRERFLDSRLQTETAISGRLTAQRDALAPVETALDDSGPNGISSAMQGFFNSFSDLETYPNSVPLRAAIVGKGAEMSNAFGSTRARLEEIRRLTDGDVRGTAEQVNELTKRVADLNQRISIGESKGSSVAELRDQRGELVRQVSELTGARASENLDHTVSLTLADGRPLVLGPDSNDLTFGSVPPDGLTSLLLNGAPAAIVEGKLRGLSDAIAQIGNHILGLDQLASSVVARVNALHSAGADLNGNAGVNFFAVPAGGVTAANIAVADVVKADSRLVVAAAPAAGSGDGSVARSIAQLLSDNSSTAGARTGTFNSIFGAMVADAGAGVKSAEDALVTQQAILNQVTAQRDSYSGVSLDEEAISLMQYQKAYEAAARFLKIADEMTQTIMSLGQ